MAKMNRLKRKYAKNVAKEDEKILKRKKKEHSKTIQEKDIGHLE